MICGKWKAGGKSVDYFPLFIYGHGYFGNVTCSGLSSPFASRPGNRPAVGMDRIPLRTRRKWSRWITWLFTSPRLRGRGGQIEFVAEVRGHELTTRAELLKDEADHPRAKEEYYKIQIGGLEKLKEPILADKWKRMTFLYTTGEYLLNAKTLNDLVVDGDERQVLWRSLRERAENEQLYKTDLPEADIPPEYCWPSWELRNWIAITEKGERLN